MAGMRAPKFERAPRPDRRRRHPGRAAQGPIGQDPEDRRDTALLRVFLDTGCRLAEVTDLRQGDVDIDDQTIGVRGKGNRVRVVTFGIKTAQALDRYLRALERDRPERVADPTTGSGSAGWAG